MKHQHQHPQLLSFVHEDAATNQVLRERERIVSRLLTGYCRKLLAVSDDKYVSKEEVLYHVHHVLHILGVEAGGAESPAV